MAFAKNRQGQLSASKNIARLNFVKLTGINPDSVPFARFAKLLESTLVRVSLRVELSYKQKSTPEMQNSIPGASLGGPGG